MNPYHMSRDELVSELIDNQLRIECLPCGADDALVETLREVFAVMTERDLIHALFGQRQDMEETLYDWSF